MKNIITLFLLGLSIIATQAAWAGCESSILEGSHTALKKKEAKLGALEDAKEACYPGAATKLSMRCEKVNAEKNFYGKAATRCVQEISCNVCGDDLKRKYEALD